MSGHSHSSFEHLFHHMQGVSLLVAVVTAALLGSLHCVAMCGAISASATGSKASNVIKYQLGRLIGYASIGAFLAYLGKSILGDKLNWLSGVASFLVNGYFIYLAIKVFMGEITVIETGNSKHANKIHGNSHPQRKPAKPDPKNPKNRQMHEYKRHNSCPRDMITRISLDCFCVKPSKNNRD